MTHHIEAPPRWIARNRSRDHPRSRGVYFAGQDAINPPRGSSPLARGLRKTELAQMYARRIIPARAGFTGPRPVRRRRRAARDHPRSRGVYPPPGGVDPVQPGSSPLARGLLHLVNSRSHINRIIPARAGFTVRWTRRECGRGDHPRSRGVYVELGAWKHEGNGSSPLARGLLQDQSPQAVVTTDHPRSRGVYAAAVVASLVIAGSSPLARGLRRAGGTLPRWVMARAGRDHPRSRGVYLPEGSPRMTPRGSSPLARGLRREARVLVTGPRIIPARAGFTLLELFVLADFAGSSPLARGLPQANYPQPLGSRIIPARAGFTE